MICCLLEFLAHLDFESFVCFFLSLPIFWSHFGRLACCLRFFGDYFCFGDCPKGKVLGKKLERLHELLSVCFFWHLLFEGFVCFLCLSMFCVHLGSLVCCLRFFGIVFLLRRRVCFVLEIEFEIRRRLHHLFLSDYFDAVLFLARNGGERFLDRSGGEKLILSIFLIYVDGVCVLKN